METLPAWCTTLMAEYTDSDARAEAVARQLTHEQVNWKPRPDAWSIGQCLEHLAAGNELYLEEIEAALTRNLDTGPVQDLSPGVFTRYFIRAYMEPSEQTRRAKAPGRIRPAADVDASILDRFLRSNERARALMRRASDYDVNRVRFRNPFVPVIRLTIGGGFMILSAHERRHLRQAERVRDLLP
jgi:hypothetical protein